jgi:glycosyltransferase involved in cell wall biosynthesis
VGRIDPIKNIELVIDAFHLLSERNQDSQLTLIGGGDAEYVATLKSRAAAGPGAGRIDFAGPLSRVDVLTRLRNAAASVLVSRSEGLSMALLESLAVGTPAVVTQAAAPAIIRDSGAVLVSGSTPAHVAEAMEQIVFSAPTRHALAWRAADLVSREFATAVVSDRMKTLYRSVLESRA